MMMKGRLMRRRRRRRRRMRMKVVLHGRAAMITGETSGPAYPLHIENAF